MKIFSWNVNGIRAVIKKELFFSFLDRFDPDILCLQETKAHPEQVEVELDAYTAYWNPAERKGYSGTAIFTKIPPGDVLYGLPEDIKERYDLTDEYGDTTKEGRVLTLSFPRFYISTVYTPNAKEDLTRLPVRTNWDSAYLAYMNQLAKKKPVIFCGDLNVAHTEDDLARPKENEGNKGFTAKERAGFDAIIASGYVDTFRQFHTGNGYYTWWTHWANARARNVGWRIDYMLVSPALKPHLKGARIHSDVYGSDHCPISIELEIPK